MTGSNYQDVLTTQKREMQIGMIIEFHPVYRDFSFLKYSDQKIAEMYDVLVIQNLIKRDTRVQTKV